MSPGGIGQMVDALIETLEYFDLDSLSATTKTLPTGHRLTLRVYAGKGLVEIEDETGAVMLIRGADL